MAKDNNISFGMATGANIANTALGQLGSTFFGKIHDQRQLEQQKKLNKLQIAGNKELSDYERMQQMKIWNDTNFGAQIKHAKDAGMSISALYGGSGAGGATTGGGGGGSVTGGIAPDGNSSTGMGLQMASQLALMEAQKENIEADTANKKAGAGLDTAKTDTEKELAELKGNERTISDRTMKEQETIVEQKALASKLENELTKIKTQGGKIENQQKEAELAVKRFEAKMAESGLSPKTPWYIKLLTDLADKHGLNLLK